jgi:branched-chain amino acid transport system permease protein
MMIFRPEGLLPEDRRRQELHADDPVQPVSEIEQTPPTPGLNPET